MQYNQWKNCILENKQVFLQLQLKENQPCPICGSLHHPHPAQIEKEDITKEKLDQQAKKVKQQEHRLQDILQKYSYLIKKRKCLLNKQNNFQVNLIFKKRYLKKSLLKN